MKYNFKVLILFLMLFVIPVNAELRIEITEGVDSAQKVGVVPFKLVGGSVFTQEIHQVVSNDLRNSGKFNPINLIEMPQQPSNISEITTNLWSSLGVTALVIGKIQQTVDDNFLINYQLIGITENSRTILLQNQFKVTKKILRYVAHAISDVIFEKLTGVRGAFCTKIAYVVVNKNKNYSYELRVSDYDGYNYFTVHRSPEPIMSPTWSPDGKKLAYVTFETGNSAIVIKNMLNGTVQQIASFPCHNGAPAFSPDGTKLAFALSKTGSLNLYLMDMFNGQIRQITNNSSNNTEPSWMPDNKTLMYTSDQSGSPQIYKINIYNGNSERISWEGSKNQNSDVSLDGSFLVMVSSNNGRQHIVKQDLVTNEVKFLTETFLDETPSIAPNGSMVIYSSSYEEGTKLQLVSSNGRFNTRIKASGRQVKFPAWSPYL
ncbi:Protein TolB [Candidatus Providencia siddallii]|uniref:Tol-Pal system protein TolB n=1 Tax=Candidatus Providencia siddallii TaxID=1715285 RepID=A0A0M6W7T5_9GAMM|nr:Protein TolB [Candidatus Providencia siddallii]